MKKIPLTRGKFALVDNEDYTWLSQWKWLAIKGKNGNFYAARSKWRKGGVDSECVLMHRIIMNSPIKKQVDHIDHNGLNNQKYNLRLVTGTQNNANRLPTKNTSSKFKGVCWDKNRNKWHCKIQVNKKQINIGRFELEIDAAFAYDKAAKKYFGEFALLNL